jgi:hypothetical protein
VTEPLTIAANQPVSIRAYARHRGVVKSAVEKAIRTGRITPTPDGMIDPSQADADCERKTAQRPSHRNPISSGRTTGRTAQQRPQPGFDTSSLGGYAAARSVREQYLARITKIQHDQLTGKVVSRDEVQVQRFNECRMIRDGILNIPSRLAGQLAAETDERKVHQLLSKELRSALIGIADTLDSQSASEQ